MIKNYKSGERHTVIEYRLVFDDGCYSGFSFPCDVNGKLLEDEITNPAAYKNYQFCLEHPEQFVRFNEIESREYTQRDNPTGTCHCGNHVVLYDAYMGACQCEKCGQWYNLFGQELVDPKYWEN